MRIAPLLLITTALSAGCALRATPAAAPAPDPMTGEEVALSGPCGGQPPAVCGEQAWVDWYEASNLTASDKGLIIARLVHACELGHDFSCMIHGDLLFHGHIGPADDALVVDLFRRSCTAGLGHACNQLGIIYGRGQGVDHDDVRAVELYAKACELGDLNGCGNYGYRLYAGRGIAMDLERAYEVNALACEAGGSLACWWLGMAYLNGKGVARDVTRAVEFLELACDRSGFGCADLGMLYSEGTVVEQDDRAAGDTFARGCRQRQADSCGRLGGLVLRKRYPAEGLPPLESILESACRQRVRPACVDLATLYERGIGVPVDLPAAADILERACDIGSGEGCLRASRMWRDGVHAPAEPERASELAWEGCRLRYITSCLSVFGHEPPTDEAARRELATVSEWFATQCHAEEPLLSGCVAAGLLSAADIGPTPGIEPALALLTGACAGGDVFACSSYLRVVQERDLSPEGIETVLEDLYSWCQDRPDPHCVSGVMAREREVAGARRDRPATRALAGRLCDADIDVGCAWAAFIVGQDGDQDEARSLMEKACRLGSGWACENLEVKSGQ